MSAAETYVDETAEEWIANPESNGASWSDDELFENMAQIINENFIMEVEASLEFRD